MSQLDEKHRSYLRGTFGSRVSFHEIERKLYGHDIAVLPILVKPLLGNTIPDAIVQPENEEELISLIQWAQENNIPLTPRGKASSGYGGVLPIKQGVVVDFYRMNRIVRIDPNALTVTVQAGLVWEKLDRRLEQQGLTLRLYPSSYPASTGYLSSDAVPAQP